MIPQQFNPDQFNKIHEKPNVLQSNQLRFVGYLSMMMANESLARYLVSKELIAVFYVFKKRCILHVWIRILSVYYMFVACADSDLYNVDDWEINKHRITYKVNSSFYPSRNKRFSFTFKLFGAGIVFDGVFLYYLAVLTVNRWRLALLPFFFHTRCFCIQMEFKAWFSPINKPFYGQNDSFAFESLLW